MLARTALSALRIPLSVKGVEKIPNRAILAFNHASYMDAIVVAAVLPGQPTYVVKKELASQLFAGPLLRRLGALFLDRFEVADSLADLAGATAAAAGGSRVLIFFPEGTFTRRPGLSGFYLGAFRVATETRLPVVPAILRGTRSILRADQWFPRWSPISLTISDPIKPSGSDLPSAVQLRDAVRAVILANCGEPDLGELIKPSRHSHASTRKHST